MSSTAQSPSTINHCIEREIERSSHNEGPHLTLNLEPTSFSNEYNASSMTNLLANSKSVSSIPNVSKINVTGSFLNFLNNLNIPYTLTINATAKNYHSGYENFSSDSFNGIDEYDFSDVNTTYVANLKKGSVNCIKCSKKTTRTKCRTCNLDPTSFNSDKRSRPYPKIKLDEKNSPRSSHKQVYSRATETIETFIASPIHKTHLKEENLDNDKNTINSYSQMLKIFLKERSIKNFDFSQFSKRELIGRGAPAMVYSANFKRKTYALKDLNNNLIMDKKTYKKFIREILRDIKGEKVVAGTPIGYKDLFMKCWSSDPNQRPSSVKVFKKLEKLSTEIIIESIVNIIDNRTF
ncbi:23887_t:CDS:2 [Dentiscutata erythropus]|uniref:23887_t:CDS:1 n=1 Tax=Dentiscutata erythropus TaxID=1348616 RepID=A0A9N9NGR7_9GLOM|nr:23887_t:CDS:2 [Dentiscutata erythropus]